MSMMLSFLLLFLLPILIRFYMQKKDDYIHPHVWSSRLHGQYSFLTILAFFSIAILDFLLIIGIFDQLLLWWSALVPFVNLPAINTGAYYYLNCLLLGIVDLHVPIHLAPFYSPQILCLLILIGSYSSIYRNGQGWGAAIYGRRPHREGINILMHLVRKPPDYKEREAEWKANAPKRAAKKEETDRMIKEGLELAETLGMKDRIVGFKSD
ncbi:MAG: hypothetical protein ACXQS8_03170 [Candidatus Helarchaeales archaeon]